MPSAYYNEHDKRTAQHLRNVIDAGMVCPGDVDDRDIRDVLPSDLNGYEQVHLFAGIGIWSLALRWAGVPDNRPVWTASCPCQPFSAAGSRKGFADERHLWPAAYWLITQCRPETIYGEQVASADGLAWFDFVSFDLENAGYATRAADLCSAGLGAPNIRQRLYWFAGLGPVVVGMADADRGQRSRLAGSKGRISHGSQTGWQQSNGQLECSGETSRLGHTESGGRGEHGLFSEAFRQRQDAGQFAQPDETIAGHLGNAGNARLPHAQPCQVVGAGRRQEGRAAEQPSRPSDPWRRLEWLQCRDGKLRPTQPGLFPLAARNPGDVGILRAAGNAINPYVAEAFIRACEGF